MTASGAPPRAPRQAALGFIYGAVMMNVVTMGVTAPVFPVLLKTLAHADDAHGARIAGVFGAAWAVMQFIFAPIFGSLSDRFGRRPVLLVSIAGAAIDYLVMAFTPVFWVLLVGRAIAGITSANMAVATAYISDMTEEQDRAKRTV